MFHRLDMGHVVSHKIWKLNANRISGHQYTIDWSESKTQSSLLAIFISKSLMPLPSVTLLQVLNLSFPSIFSIQELQFFTYCETSTNVAIKLCLLTWFANNLYTNVCLVHCLRQFYLSVVPVLLCGLWLVRETSACWFNSCLQIVRALMACSYKENARCWCFIFCTRLARQSRWSCTGLHTFPIETHNWLVRQWWKPAAICLIHQQRLVFGWLTH